MTLDLPKPSVAIPPEIPWTIRPMQSADIGRVIEIASFSADAPSWPSSAYEACIVSENPRRIALVVVDVGSKSIEGFAIASLIPPEAELETIAVSPEFRRRGVAGVLLNALREKLVINGIEALILEVRASNEAALAFYRKIGFLEEGHRRGYYSHPNEDAVLMRLRLNSAHAQLRFFR